MFEQYFKMMVALLAVGTLCALSHLGQWPGNVNSYLMHVAFTHSAGR